MCFRLLAVSRCSFLSLFPGHEDKLEKVGLEQKLHFTIRQNSSCNSTALQKGKKDLAYYGFLF